MDLNSITAVQASARRIVDLLDNGERVDRQAIVLEAAAIIKLTSSALDKRAGEED